MHDILNKRQHRYRRWLPLAVLLLTNLLSSVVAEGATTNAWTRNGPFSSAIHALAFRGIAASGTVVAGTNGAGIYRSTNSGSSWATANTGLPAGTSINALVASGTSFFAATAGNGLYTSSDDGLNWTPVAAIPADADVTAVITNGTALYAAIKGGGVFRSDDGVAWSDISGNLGNLNVLSLAAVPPGDPPAALLAGTAGDGVYRGTFNGTIWSWTKATGLAGRTVLSVAVDTSAPTVAYAGTFGSSVYKSTDGGATWSVPANSGLPANATVSALQFLSPTLYAETDAGFFTTPDAANWTTVKGGVTATSLAFAPNGAKMFLGTTAGVYVTSDSGSTWNATAAVSYTTDIRATAIDPISPAIIYSGGSGSGAFKSLNAGTTWSIINSGLGDATVNGLLARGTTLYAAASSGVFKTTDGGTTWTPATTGLPVADVRALAVDTAATTLYAATSTGVYKTPEGAIGWTAAGAATLVNRDVTSIAVDSSSAPSVIYAGTASGVFKSTDNGATWSLLNDGLPNPPIIRSLTADTRTPARVYAATPGGLFRLDPMASLTWNRVSTDFTDVTAVAAATNPLYVFAGTNGNGFYISSDGAITWLPLNTGLPPSSVVQSIAIDSGIPKKAYAGLADNGAAAITVSPTISLGGTTSLNYGTIFRDSTSSRVVTIGNTGTVPLFVSALTFSGTDAGMFSAVPGSCPALPQPGIPLEIQPGDSCTIDITFTPTSTGPHTGTLTITGDDVNTPTSSISLQGSAITLAATITAPANGAYLYGTSTTITGTAAASGTTVSRVEVSINNGPFTTVTGTNSWSYPWTLPVDGTYSIQARAFDASGQLVTVPSCSNVVAPFDCLSVTVNNVLPVSSITTPVDGAILTGDVHPITGTAFDAGAGVQKVDVSISADSGLTWTDYLASGTTSWSINWTPPGSGRYIIRSLATDNDNKVQATPAAITVNVDSIFPSSAITAPTNGAILNGTSYVVRGSASDSGGSGLKTVEVSVDGGATWPTAAGLATWNYTWSIPAGTFGTFTVRSRATDNAGNVETPLPPVTVTVDNIPPTSGISLSQLPPQFLSGTSYTFDVAASDTGVGVQKVQISIDNGSWIDMTPPVSSGWTYTWTLPADGAYSVRTKAIDLAGNEQTTPYQLTVNVNNDPPVVSILQPVDGAALNTTQYTVIVAATDVGAGVKKVEVSIGGVLYLATLNGATGNWEYVWTLPTGETTYTIFARATDNQDRVQTTAPITIMTDRTSPVSTISWPLSGAELNGSTVTILGTSSDPFTPAGPGSGISMVQISFDGSTWYPATTSDNWVHWRFDWLLPVTETHLSIQSRAIDRAGNVQIIPYSTPVNVYQVPPTSTITAPTAGARLRGTNFTITGTALDLGLGIKQVYVSTDGGTTWNLATGTTTWTYSWQLPVDGPYILVSRATNNVDYVQSAMTPITVIVDNTPPVSTITSKPALYSNTSSPTFVFTANEAGTFECRLDGAAYAPCTATSTFPGLADGSHSLTVRAVDLAGNADPAPLTYTWTVDTIPPQITTISPPDNTIAISVTTQPTATFSEAIDPATLTTATFSLGNGTAGTVAYDANTRTATFRPSPRLAYATTYTVTVSTGVKDLAGNPLPAPLTWTFATDPDGDINLDGVVDIADAVLCLKHIVSGLTLSPLQIRHGNVGPLNSNGKPNPNGKIDIGDAVVILERVVGLASW